MRKAIPREFEDKDKKGNFKYDLLSNSQKLDLIRKITSIAEKASELIEEK